MGAVRGVLAALVLVSVIGCGSGESSAGPDNSLDRCESTSMSVFELNGPGDANTPEEAAGHYADLGQSVRGSGTRFEVVDDGVVVRRVTVVARPRATFAASQVESCAD